MKRLTIFCLFLSTSVCALAQSGTWSFRKETRPGGKSADKVAMIFGKDPTGKEVLVVKERDTDEISDGDTTSISDSYSIVSYAGPFVTVLHNRFEYMHGAAHPNVRREFEVIDARVLQMVKLTDFYSEQQVFDVLRQDKFIQSSMTKGAKPKNLADLFAALETTCEVEFSDGMLGSFAFHHMEPGKVAIRIGLPNSCAVANGSFTQLGAFFPIPEKLKVWLPAAASGKTLMKDLLPKISQYE